MNALTKSGIAQEPRDDEAYSVELAPDWHPLASIDNFILACGWTHEEGGFVPPESWRAAIAMRHGGGRHWRREHAAQFCVRHHERASGWSLKSLHRAKG